MVNDRQPRSLRPRKRLGQHFLTDPQILDRIVRALALTGSETVVEIGAGHGALTGRLVPHCGRLIAIELDRDLAPRLRERFSAEPRVTVVESDVLDVSLAELAGGPYSVIGNVPYYITTPILFHALHHPWPVRAVFLVQREVAERLRAEPGGSEYGALSVNVQAVARVENLFRIAPGAFNPPPTVDSAVVRITPRADAVVAPEEEEAFRRFVQTVFAQRRKQLRTIVRSLTQIGADEATAILSACGIVPEARPETLPAARFAQLWRTVSGTVDERV